MVALEESGFNHVAAPLVRWVWEGSDLGVVQEPLADRSAGWALALTSLRDFYASGGSPEVAGADFGTEARALGTMTARMHLALDSAFQREHEPVMRVGRRGRGDHRRIRRVPAGGPGRHRSGEVAPRVRSATAGHPHSR